MTSQPTRLSRGAATIVGLALMVTGLLAAAPFTPAANAAWARPSLSAFDSRLVADMNHARAAHGLHGLVATAGTTDIAHSWTCHLAAGHVLAHNGRLAAQLPTHGSRNWTAYAENVGYEAASAHADALFRAYMNSPEHRSNILDPSARFVGVWTKRAGGTRYNTIDFVGATTRAYSNTYGASKATC
jgi:uncharacterized protein YkwD